LSGVVIVVIGIAYILCGAGFVHLLGVCLSVPLFFVYLFIAHEAAKKHIQTKNTQNPMHCHNLPIETQRIGYNQLDIKT